LKVDHVEIKHPSAPVSTLGLHVAVAGLQRNEIVFAYFPIWASGAIQRQPKTADRRA